MAQRGGYGGGRRTPYSNFDTRYVDFYQRTLDAINNRARAELGVPGSMFRLTKSGQLALTPQFLHMMGYRVTRSLTNLIVDAANRGTRGVADGVMALAAGLVHATEHDKRAQRSANAAIATGMRQALLENYGRTIERRKQVPSYRVGQNRYSGGALRRALQARDMAVATEDSIQYINQDRLNQEARHWARLNFGVAPANTPESFQGSLKFAGTSIGTVGFRVQPRPPMFMPAGFWNFVEGKISSGPLVQVGTHERTVRYGARNVKFEIGGHTLRLDKPYLKTGVEFPTMRHSQPEHNKKRGWRDNYGSYTKTGVRVSRQGFFPTSSAPRYPTRGVVGVNFLDAGLKAFVRLFPEEYDKLILGWIEDAQGSGFPGGHAGSAALYMYRAYAVKDQNSPFVSMQPVKSAGYGFNAGRKFGMASNEEIRKLFS